MADNKKDKQAPDRLNIEEYKGIEKAAAFMLALAEDKAAIIFEMMDDEEIRELSQAMASLGHINASVIEKIFVEFTNSITSTASLTGSYESTERLLRSTLPKDKVENIMEEIRGPAGRTIWEKLSNVSEEVLASYLKNEYPQTVSVVFSRIPARHAAKVLKLFPPAFAQDVLVRMLRMESVSREVLNDVESTLRREFMNNLSRTTKRDPHSMVAEIFNFLDRGEEEKFLVPISEKAPESAEKIRSLMFTFDDLEKIDDTGIQVLIRKSDKEKLLYALKGSSEKLRNTFLRNLGERAAKIMREDIANLGGVRLKQVTEAQSSIIQVAKELITEGEIILNNGASSDDKIIY